MKCPERYNIEQHTIRQPLLDIDNIVRGEHTVLFETQNFRECYKEKCAAWDKEKQICKKVGGE